VANQPLSRRRALALSAAGGEDTPMDGEQLLQLRSWAGRLASDDRGDVRAAAKAIVMLADEVEALWAERRQPSEGIEAAETTAAAPVRDDAVGEVGSVLRGRLHSFARERRSKHGRESLSGESIPGDRPS
jgi:hypothetical protein